MAAITLQSMPWAKNSRSLSGSAPVAAEAKLVFWVGGDAIDVEMIRPLLLCMGNKIIHAGGHGMGASMKIVINLLLGNAMGTSVGHSGVSSETQWAEWNTAVDRYGVGVEEEVMLLDPHRQWALAQRIEDVLAVALPKTTREKVQDEVVREEVLHAIM